MPQPAQDTLNEKEQGKLSVWSLTPKTYIQVLTLRTCEFDLWSQDVYKCNLVEDLPLLLLCTPARWLVGLGIEFGPLAGKHRVLTTGPPGNSQLEYLGENI